MPVQVSYPGVYIEEISSGVHTIVGVSTSVTAFVGKTLRGPVGKPARVLSFADYSREFGGLSNSSEVSHAVQAFFLNGGAEAWIVRVVKEPVAASVNGGLKVKIGNADETVFDVTAKYEGKAGNAITINVDYNTPLPDSTFDLSVSYAPPDNPADAQTERFTNLSMNRNDARYAPSVVQRQSDLIVLADVLDPVKRTDALKAVKGVFTSGALVDKDKKPLNLTKLVTARSNQFTVIVNGLPATVMLDATKDAKDGPTLATAIQAAVQAAGTVPALKNFTCQFSSDKLTMTSGEAGEASRVEVMPGVVNDAYGKLKLSLGEGATQQDATAVLRPPAGSKILEGGDEKDFDVSAEPHWFAGDIDKREGIFALEGIDLFNLLVLPGMRDPTILSLAAGYCKDRRAFLIADSPGGDESDPVTPNEMEQTIKGTAYPKIENAAVFYPWVRVGDALHPPSGTVAGVFARTDGERGVWKADAGTAAQMLGVQGVEYVLTDRENGVLNPRGVNCLRNFPVYGPVVWGARTLLGDDAQANEWKYIPVRRTALFIEESLYRGLKWVVFEPNDEPLWASIRLNVGAFMHNLFRQGAFQGSSPKDAYFVKCDKDTTTQADINLGIVNIVVGFAPLKPAEFVIVKIQQMAGQLDV